MTCSGLTLKILMDGVSVPEERATFSDQKLSLMYVALIFNLKGALVRKNILTLLFSPHHSSTS
mgnify:CR=1 FL=1